MLISMFGYVFISHIYKKLFHFNPIDNEVELKHISALHTFPVSLVCVTVFTVYIIRLCVNMIKLSSVCSGVRRHDTHGA